MTFSKSDFLSRPAVGAPKQTLPAKVIAEHWQVSPSYISQLRKSKNMPDFASLEEADKWRTDNCGSARQRKSQTSSKHDSDQLPALDLSKILGNNGDFDAQMIEAAQMVPKAAFELYMQSVSAGNDAVLNTRIRNWGDACKQAAIIRKEFVELQEKTGQLLPMDIMLDVVGEILQALVYALDTLDSKYAKKANPDNPELAKAVLNKAADEIKQRVLESEERVRSEVFSRREVVESKTREANA